MAPFMTLIFLLVMAMVGFVFDLYLFSRGAFGNRYDKNTKFTRSPSINPAMNDEDGYEFYVCSDTKFDNDRTSRAHTVLVVLSAGIVILVLFLFMLVNSISL